MDVYKEYLHEMSTVQYKVPYIMVSWMYPPRLMKRFIAMIINIPFEESNYHAYYGRIKMACLGCLFCYLHCLQSSEVLVDKYKHVLSLNELREITHNTVMIHDSYHQEILKEFQPINSEKEQKQLDEIISTYHNFKKKLTKLCEYIFKMHKQDEVMEFTKDQLETCLEINHATGEFTREFIARIICSKLERLRISLEEIQHRIQKSYDDYKDMFEEGLETLYNEMYDHNKENLNLRRAEYRSSRETCEIENKIETIKHKITALVNKETSQRLESEMQYWSRLLRYFDETASIITKVKTGLERAKLEKKIHALYKPDPGQKSCWSAMDKQYDDLVQDLENRYRQACMPIITAFICPGIDCIRYEDNIGTYFIDNFGHKNYITDYGARIFHIVCDGELVENCEEDKYYFDDCGRYIIEDGEKVYQLAPCTPKYKMNKQGLFEKCTPCQCKVSCKHLEENCVMDLHKMPEKNLEVLPETVNIKNTLSSDDVNYLWETFGYILPEILSNIHDIATNPIHEIAHLLLMRNNTMSDTEKRAKIKEAHEYREGILQKRKDEAAAKYNEYRRKLVKACKPEELDKTNEKAEVVANSSQEKEQEYYLEQQQ